MNSIPKSGYYYPNKLALASFHALIELMGKNGFNAMLNLAHLGNFIHNYPPDDLEKGIDFADFSAIQMTLEEMYGVEGGQLFLKRAGKATFRQSLCMHGALAGVCNPAFRTLPLPMQMRIGIQALRRIMTQISDQWITVEEDDAEIKYSVHRCPHCWGRAQQRNHICTFGTGFLEEGLKYISGGLEFHVQETRCLANGEAVCEYTIEKQPLEV
jgi:predicted hydrocarbon binding protein